MLKKLLKYDLPKMFKFLSIFYGLSILFSLLTRLFLGIENSLVALIIGEIFRGATISMMFSIVINNLMRFWVLFRQNLYGDESYLTHTLPVPRESLYASKMITAVVTMLVSVLVVMVSLLIMFYSDTFEDIVKAMLSSAVADTGISVWGVVISMVVLAFFQFVNMLQSGLTGIILGNRQPNHKIGHSVLFGFVSYITVQMIILVVMGILTIFMQELAEMITSNQMPSASTFLIVMWVCSAVYVVLMGAFWFVNTRLLKKGVDVE